MKSIKSCHPFSNAMDIVITYSYSLFMASSKLNTWGYNRLYVLKKVFMIEWKNNCT